MSDAVADRRLAVVVPVDKQSPAAFEHQRSWVVLAHLEFVADDGHFRVEILLRDEAIDHRSADQSMPTPGCRRSPEGLVVVRAVDPGGAVDLESALVESTSGFRMILRAFEDHVLEQVGHAGFAVALVPRADQVRDVDRGRGLGRIGKQQDPQAVVEPVLGDALDSGPRVTPAGSGARAVPVPSTPSTGAQRGVTHAHQVIHRHAPSISVCGFCQRPSRLPVSAMKRLRDAQDAPQKV